MIRKSAFSASISLMATLLTSPPDNALIFIEKSGSRKDVSSSFSRWTNAAFSSSWNAAVSRLLWDSTWSSMLESGDQS